MHPRPGHTSFALRLRRHLPQGPWRWLALGLASFLTTLYLALWPSVLAASAQLPSGTPVPTPSQSPVSAPSPIPSASSPPSPAVTPSPAATPPPAATPSPAASPSATPAATPVGAPSATPSATPSPAASPAGQAGDLKTEPQTLPTDPPKGPKPKLEIDPKPVKTAEDLEREKSFIEADRLWLAGQTAEAETRYRQLKPAFSSLSTSSAPKLPLVTDPNQLPPAGQVYWREVQAGLAQNLDTRISVALNLLIEKHPEFLPAHLTLAQRYQAQGQMPQAVKVLDALASRYADNADLVKTKIDLLDKTEAWLEASVAARQFALLYPTHPQVGEFQALADQHLKRYQKRLKSRITGNLVGNLLTGALGYAITGNIFGPLTAVQSTLLLLKGEAAVGDRFVRQAKKQLDLVKDETLNAYISGIGQKLAQAAGRNEFKYEFFILGEKDLNAFALPGGKVFINAGAIAKSHSEAEIAGLLAHEISHAVLSHSFQIITKNNLTSSIFQFIPYGGLINDIVTLSYSREMERQADILGTRLLVATDYASDGLRNLMVTLDKENKRASINFLSSHPVSKQRVAYLESLITDNNYNRYRYEGVDRHQSLQPLVEKAIAEAAKRQEKRKRGEKVEEESPSPAPSPAPAPSPTASPASNPAPTAKP